VDSKAVAIEPKSFDAYESAVSAGGGFVAKLDSSVEALIWTDYHAPEKLDEVIAANPQLTWVQLPFAGVDAFSAVIQRDLKFTSAKGSYSEPVAEHALSLSLALARSLPERAKAVSWGRRFALSLYDSKVLILGAGGITKELINLLRPFRCEITVVRNLQEPMDGANKTVNLAQFQNEVADADLIIVACALTSQTRGIVDSTVFKAMKPTGLLVNVARGPVVNTSHLIDALNSGQIAGAAVDVTDPEPLPDGHPLWTAKNVLITPHTADTKEMVIRLFSHRIQANVAAFHGTADWVGVVDPALGY
jgi:phosphoglycerate dehydrogenase-like enzyme